MLFLYQVYNCKYPAVWGEKGFIRYKTTMKSYKNAAFKLSKRFK